MGLSLSNTDEVFLKGGNEDTDMNGGSPCDETVVKADLYETRRDLRRNLPADTLVSEL
jgi:hypothetical protein